MLNSKRTGTLGVAHDGSLLLGFRIGGDDETVRPPVVMVVAGGKVDDGGGEVVGEGGPVGGVAEADLGVDRHRRQSLAHDGGLAGEVADLAHGAAGEGDEIAGRQVVGGGVRVHGGLTHCPGRHDVAGGGCLQEAFGDAAVLTLGGEDDEAMSLERPQVVVDLLAGDADTDGERRRRRRLGELSEQARPHRIEGDRRCCGILDDLDVVHAAQYHP